MWRRSDDQIIRALVLALCLFCFGCSRRLQDDRVAGTYVAEADWGTSTLILKTDHTFEQSVATKSGVLKKINGQWELNSSGSGNSIAFSPKYLGVTHDKKGVESDGAFASVDSSLLGTVEISADPDYGIVFKKK